MIHCTGCIYESYVIDLFRCGCPRNNMHVPFLSNMFNIRMAHPFHGGQDFSLRSVS